MTILMIEITDEDWEKAKIHFDTIEDEYRKTSVLMGIADEEFDVLNMAFGPLLARYQAGERTAALYEAMMGVE